MEERVSDERRQKQEQDAEDGQEQAAKEGGI
jgi:hypothetical protein